MHSVRVSVMAYLRSASAMLRRGLLVEFSLKRGRLLASSSTDLAERITGSRSGSEGSGWRASSGVVGGVAALTGFMSLLHDPVMSRSEGVQQIEGPPVTETLVSRYVEIWFRLMFSFLAFLNA